MRGFGSRALGHLRGNVVAYLALALALATGGAYAAEKIGSGDIAANAVRAKHLSAGALTEKHGIIRTGRIDIVDPHPQGDTEFTTKRLLRFGPFTIRGSCRDLGSYGNGATIESKRKAFAIGTLDNIDPDDIGSTPAALSPAVGSLNAGGTNPRAVTAFTPKGQWLSVSVFEVNKVAGSERDGKPDCSFWVFGQGRK